MHIKIEQPATPKSKEKTAVSVHTDTQKKIKNTQGITFAKVKRILKFD